MGLHLNWNDVTIDQISSDNMNTSEIWFAIEQAKRDELELSYNSGKFGYDIYDASVANQKFLVKIRSMAGYGWVLFHINRIDD